MRITRVLRALLAVAGIAAIGTVIGTNPAAVTPDLAITQPAMSVTDADSAATYADLTLGIANFADSLHNVLPMTSVAISAAPDIGITAIIAAITQRNLTGLASRAALTPLSAVTGTITLPITRKVYGLTENEVLRVDGKADVKAANYLAKEHGTPATLDAHTVVDPLIQAGVLSA